MQIIICKMTIFAGTGSATQFEYSNLRPAIMCRRKRRGLWINPLALLLLVGPSGSTVSPQFTSVRRLMFLLIKIWDTQ